MALLAMKRNLIPRIIKNKFHVKPKQFLIGIINNIYKNNVRFRKFQPITRFLMNSEEINFVAF